MRRTTTFFSLLLLLTSACDGSDDAPPLCEPDYDFEAGEWSGGEGSAPGGANTDDPGGDDDDAWSDDDDDAAADDDDSTGGDGAAGGCDPSCEGAAIRFAWPLLLPWGFRRRRPRTLGAPASIRGAQRPRSRRSSP